MKFIIWRASFEHMRKIKSADSMTNKMQVSSYEFIDFRFDFSDKKKILLQFKGWRKTE